MYKLMVEDLTEQQALDNVRELVKSEYFGSYLERECEIWVNAFASKIVPSDRPVFLSMIADSLDGLLERCQGVREVRLKIQGSPFLKTSIGVDESKEAELNLLVSVQRDKDLRYAFSVLHVGLESKAYPTQEMFLKDRGMLHQLV